MNTNQKIKADAGKARLDLVPHGVIWAIARVREYGCNKYPGSTENWRDVEIWRYRAAAFRHLLRYLENPRGLDDESGLPHLHHLACNVAFLVDLEEAQQNQKGDPWEAERAVAEAAKNIKACINCKHEEREITEEPCNSCETDSGWEPKEGQCIWPRAYNNHEVACILAEVTGDDCACNVNGNDEWLPTVCDISADTCPNVVGVTCWEQWLKHRKKIVKEAADCPWK